MEIKAMMKDRRFETLSFLIIVTENTRQRHGQTRQDIKGLRLSNVSGMNDLVHPCVIEYRNDFPAIFKVIMGIADNAQTHQTILLSGCSTAFFSPTAFC
jgi:hypothetical protein